MKQPLPLLIGILVVYIIGSSIWYARTACCLGAAAAAPIGAAAATAATGTAVAAATIAEPAILANTTGLGAIDLTNDLSLNANENLYFEPSSFNFLPFSDNLSSFHRDLADYLIEHPDRTASITGRYQVDEENTSILSSIGLARANQIKNVLLEHNVPENQLLIKDDLVDAISQTDEVFDNAIVFGFEDTIDDYENLTSLEEKLRDNKITLYFDTNAKKLELDSEQRQYFTDLINYLNKNPEGIVLATGHTDNEGDWNINRYISRKRSQFVRNYLIANGIRMDQIQAKTAGAEKPVASNGTSEGRAKNRRVEITLK